MSHFKCAYCSHDQIVTSSQYSDKWSHIDVKNKKYGDIGFRMIGISCANPDCQEMTLEVSFVYIAVRNHNHVVGNSIEVFPLRPSSRAKPQPDCIPIQIRQDYYEACAIERLSPKASATLSRRCLQGMLRDFCKVVGKTLFAEIATLKQQVADGNAAQGVTEDTLAAIDAVRSIGNIGAHMEADIDLIVDIEPGEAQALIELIELLFADWYLAREARQQRLAKVQGIAAAKKLALAGPKDEAAPQQPIAKLGEPPIQY